MVSLQNSKCSNDKPEKVIAVSNETAQVVENVRRELAELKRELTVAREVISDNRKKMTTLRNEVVELKRESARVKQQTNLQEVYSRRDNLHKHC